MITAILIGTFILTWKCMAIGFKLFGKFLYFLALASAVLAFYLVLFSLNIFTVPMWVILYAFGKIKGEPTPYLDMWHLLFYPTYTNPYGRPERVKMAFPVIEKKPRLQEYAYFYKHRPLSVEELVYYDDIFEDY